MVVVCFAAGAATAENIGLTDTWRAATLHDPAFAAAQAQRDAGRAHAAQGRALWLPTVTATGSAGRGDVEGRTQGAAFSAPGIVSTAGVDFRTSINRGTATRWAFVAEQPLFDLGRIATSTMQKDTARIAEAQFNGAQQELMLQSARRYFDVLNARAQLYNLQRLRAAADQARAAAQGRYEAGDIPVTDMREAQASADAIGVQELDATTALTLAETAFADLTGLEAAQLADLPEAATADMPLPESLESWTQRALVGSPQLQARRLALATAHAQVAGLGALGAPQLDLVAQVGRDSLHGNGDFGASDISARQASIGVQATVALFTGGMRTAQRHEARALEHQAQAELDGADQQLRRQARERWLALTTAAARVRALQRLRSSATSRLDATRLGVEVGERTALELLSAQADSLRAAADFRHAQSEWLLAGLQLQAVAGELHVADLESVDRRLAAATAAPQ